MNRKITADLTAEGRMEYQRCHALGHRWANIPVMRPPAFGSAMDLQCENCATVRRDILSRVSGQLIARYYIYPEEYHDYERHDKAWWRSAFIESLRESFAEFIDTTNENAPTPGADLMQRRAAREAKKLWIEALNRLAQAGPPRPSPEAQASRRNQPTERQSSRRKRLDG